MRKTLLALSYTIILACAASAAPTVAVMPPFLAGADNARWVQVKVSNPSDKEIVCRAYLTEFRTASRDFLFGRRIVLNATHQEYPGGDTSGPHTIYPGGSLIYDILKAGDTSAVLEVAAGNGNISGMFEAQPFADTYHVTASVEGPGCYGGVSFSIQYNGRNAISLK